MGGELEAAGETSRAQRRVTATLQGSKASMMRVVPTAALAFDLVEGNRKILQ